LFFIIVTLCYFAFFCYSFVTHFAIMTTNNTLNTNKNNWKWQHERQIKKEEIIR
jgi:hypothetical protein